MKYLHYVLLHRLAFVAFTKIGRIKPVYEVVGCLQSIGTKQVHFRSHACINNEFFSAKHDCATGSQPA